MVRIIASKCYPELFEKRSNLQEVETRTRGGPDRANNEKRQRARQRALKELRRLGLLARPKYYTSGNINPFQLWAFTGIDVNVCRF